MWQKARFISSDSHPEAIGQEVWVEGKPDENVPWQCTNNPFRTGRATLFRVHVRMDEDGTFGRVRPDILELLSEFVEEPPYETLSQFTERCRAGSQR